MDLQLILYNAVQEGLRTILDSAFSMADNLRARVAHPKHPGNPVQLIDGSGDIHGDLDIWGAWIDSKTIQLYGGRDEDNRYRFKIDHAFDLARLVNQPISSGGSISIDAKTYMLSQGTEFIIIKPNELSGGTQEEFLSLSNGARELIPSAYAIRADKYLPVRKQLIKGKYPVNDFLEAGGFRINANLIPIEIVEHNDGWLELAVGKNRAAGEEYEQASRLLDDYVRVAIDRKCFIGHILVKQRKMVTGPVLKREDRTDLAIVLGGGMPFVVDTLKRTYQARTWMIDYGFARSYAEGRNGFDNLGHFLKVR